MQDMHAIGGGANAGGGGGGRFFTAGDRRARPNTHLQALKCPRCDSVNTKFCYYNNYNLSQPRHFCKSCRRYWTKGGVLRNVPVGGGCRKTKHAKQKSRGGAPPDGGDGATERAAKAQKSSSTENSGLAGASAAAEEGAAAGNMAPISAVVCDYSDAGFFNEGPNFGNRTAPVSLPTEGQIFPTEFGVFGGLTASSEMMGFGLAHIPTTSYRLQGFSTPAADNQRPVAEFKLPELKGGLNDEGMGAAVPEWGNGGGVEQGLFDLTAAVDPAYWSQPLPHLTDNDQSPLHYLP